MMSCSHQPRSEQLFCSTGKQPWMLKKARLQVIQNQAHKSNGKQTANPEYCRRIKQQNEDACVLACVSVRMSVPKQTGTLNTFNYPIISLLVHFLQSELVKCWAQTSSRFSPFQHPLGFTLSNFFSRWRLYTALTAGSKELLCAPKYKEARVNQNGAGFWK